MKLKPRFTIVGLGLLIFLIVTPILVLFARGFKVNWANGQIIKTGALVAKSDPQGALVFLDGEKLNGTTPTTGRFLTPKDYDLKIEKEGYQPWTKRLSILPQLVTWANLNREFVTLFYTKPQLLSDTTSTFTTASVYNDQLIYLKDNQVYLINSSANESQRLGEGLLLPSPINIQGTLSWQDGAGVYKNILQIPANALTPTEIAGIQKASANSDYVVLQLSGNLYSFSSKSDLSLIDTKITGFDLDTESVWYVQGGFLKNYNLRSNKNTIVASDLPASTTAQIIRGNGHVFLILDNTLYNVADTLERIYSPVSFASWSGQSGRLLAASSNEILMFDPAQKNIELIHRSVSPINDAWINAETGYAFFANEGSVKAIELDGRDHRNIYTIVDLNPDDKFILSSNGKILYVYNNSGIKSYQIR